MRATYWICLGLCAGLLAGCKDLDQCEDPGVVEPCICGVDDTGARTCQPEYVWSECDCGAAAPDSGTTGGMGGATGGMGGMTGGMGGATGGMGGATGGMGGMTGGMGGEPADAGDDSGGPVGVPYGPCTVETAAADCGAGAECRESDIQLATGAPLRICTPACSETNDCPAAPAGGTATLECTGGRCLLPCDGFTECPTGLACAAKDLVTLTCYDDGM